MKTEQAHDQKPEFGHLSSEGTGYARMQSTNPHSGRREDVILLPPDRINTLTALAVEGQVELRTDLNRAFEEFTKVQRRVLHNVLIRGMSVEVATARMKKSSVWWRRWLREEAIPALRTSLRDYRVNGEVVVR